MLLMKRMTHRVAVLGLVIGVALAAAPAAAVTGAAAEADAPRVTVTDGPGAPDNVLRQLEKLAGEPVGRLKLVFAVDTGGRSLTTEQIDALLAGKAVEGAQVLGAMSGSQNLLDTTIADLSDGGYDGPDDEGISTSTVMFATSDPNGRQWCLTMCMAAGKTLQECIRERTGRIDWISLDMPGTTTLGQTTAALERAGEKSLGQLESVEVLVSEREPSPEEVDVLLDGGDVESQRRVAKVDGPDLDWGIGDVAEKSGVAYSKCQLEIFTYFHPWYRRWYLAVCLSSDGGKTWKCKLKAWNGF